MTRHFSWLALLGVLTACSSGYSSGVDGSKPVSTLSEEEATTACLNLSDYFLDSVTQADADRFNCYVMGLSDLMATPEQCQATYDACIVDPPEGPLDREPIDCTNAMADMDCNAQVSDVEACVTAQVEAQKSRLDEIDCSIAGNLPELQRLQEELPTPPECAAIESVCPNAGF